MNTIQCRCGISIILAQPTDVLVYLLNCQAASHLSTSYLVSRRCITAVHIVTVSTSLN